MWITFGSADQCCGSNSSWNRALQGNCTLGNPTAQPTLTQKQAHKWRRVTLCCKTAWQQKNTVQLNFLLPYVNKLRNEVQFVIQIHEQNSKQQRIVDSI